MQQPSAQDVRAAAAQLGFRLDDAAIDRFRDMIAGTLSTEYAALEELTPEALGGTSPPAMPERAWRRPEPQEDPFGGWAVATSITGAASGPLAGKRVAVKDSVAVAGVPMSAGSATLAGYVPAEDATIVTRILQAGGEIAGKARAECFGLSGGSHTAFEGPSRHPWRPELTSGGSSSGSAVLVLTGAVDMAIGGDQGGSIRVPAAFCGLVGMKPSHGLVPYTGAVPVDPTLDHLGPMTMTVADNALLLGAIAGPDGRDPRQVGKDLPARDYVTALDGGVRALRIGVMAEGFGHGEARIDVAVQAAADQFRRLGATVAAASVPAHAQAMTVFMPICMEGVMERLFRGNGYATGWSGWYDEGFIAAHAGWRARADGLSEIAKFCLLLAQHTHDRYGNRHYAKAQNLVPLLRAAYDRGLADCDLLLMPTSPILPPPLPPADAKGADYFTPPLSTSVNAAPFNLTGHPALSVPCGLVDGLPAGMMLVGRMGEEATLYRAAQAFEQSVDWRDL